MIRAVAGNMLTSFRKAHVTFIPNEKKIVSLSKNPRIVDAFTRRIQVQERLTDQIKDCDQEALNPFGVDVAIEAQHMCMQMRGIQKQNSTPQPLPLLALLKKIKPEKNLLVQFPIN